MDCDPLEEMGSNFSLLDEYAPYLARPNRTTQCGSGESAEFGPSKARLKLPPPPP